MHTARATDARNTPQTALSGSFDSEIIFVRILSTSVSFKDLLPSVSVQSVAITCTPVCPLTTAAVIT